MNNSAEPATAGIVALTVNLHGTSVELRQTTAEGLVGRYSSGNYLPNGVDRLLQLFSDRAIKATFFVPGLEAEMNPGLVREIQSAGHEIAANGYALENHAELGDGELDVLKRAHGALGACTGVAPTGWRAPDGWLSARTLSLLAELGYRYDSSFQDDDFPYRLDADVGAGMVEVPQNPVLIDQTLFAVKQPDRRVLKNWTEEYNGLKSVNAFACMTLHPRQDYGVGRPPRMRILDEFLTHTQYGPKPAVFRTCADVMALVS
ncbi:polysaccharide deacetylase family protein [Oricola sp.]|uniref:polysaccharide deacetylase family protein n=1 Tax=Oricola sp. TaxID=1979950 RepID=UPI003BAAF797